MQVSRSGEEPRLDQEAAAAGCCKMAVHRQRPLEHGQVGTPHQAQGHGGLEHRQQLVLGQQEHPVGWGSR